MLSDSAVCVCRRKSCTSTLCLKHPASWKEWGGSSSLCVTCWRMSQAGGSSGKKDKMCCSVLNPGYAQKKIQRTTRSRTTRFIFPVFVILVSESVVSLTPCPENEVYSSCRVSYLLPQYFWISIHQYITKSIFCTLRVQKIVCLALYSGLLIRSAELSNHQTMLSHINLC